VTKLDIIVERVNKAANFWADTKDVDYCAGLSLKEIKEYERKL
jgi:hypothetical protein